jgi:hypothetical protein
VVEAGRLVVVREARGLTLIVEETKADPARRNVGREA